MLTTKSMSSTDRIPVVPSLPVARAHRMHVDLRVQQLVNVGHSEVITPLVENQDVEELGKGLRNEIGQYNCFLNVVIQVASFNVNCFLKLLGNLKCNILPNTEMEISGIVNMSLDYKCRDLMGFLDTLPSCQHL